MPIIALTIISSCTKEIKIELDDANKRIVMEGNITNNGSPAELKISKSVSFSAGNDYPAITNAFVTIRDGSQIDTLIHTTNGVYKGKNIIGKPGTTYTLIANVDGIDYTATSTLPNAVPLLNLKAIESTFGGLGSTEKNYLIIPQFKDPEQLGNNYRFKETINNKLSKTLIITNDINTNGLMNQRPILNISDQKKSGDSVEIEMQCIDLSIYNYFFTLSSISGNGPGGGATPTNPPSNFDKGVLGYFSAHTMETKTIVIP